MNFINVLKYIPTGFILIFFITGNIYAQVILDDFPERDGVGIEEHLGNYIPLDVVFSNDKGEEVALRKYFGQGKPVILVLAYYNCQMLCTLVLNGLSNAIQPMAWLPGKEFQILTVSIDSRETVELAAAKKNRYIEGLGKPGISNGWIFFAGEESQSRKLAEALGFKYYYDEKTDQFAHPAAIFILSENGKISRYFYGIKFKERDLRFALIDASEGKIGNTLDKIVLFCFHYNPKEKGYVLFAANIMRLGGILTVLILTIIIGSLLAREHSKKTLRNT